MPICVDELEKIDVSPIGNIQQQNQQPSTMETGLVDELVARCDYYLALYVQQVSINQKLINLQQNLAEITDAGKDISERTVTEGTVAAVPGDQPKIEEPTEVVSTVNEKKTELEKTLNELIIRNDNFAATLVEKDKQLALQNVRIAYLAAQNMKYKQLVERIKSKWYGRLMIRVYHFFCKIGIIQAL